MVERELQAHQEMTPRVDALLDSLSWRNGESTVQFVQRQFEAMTELARELEVKVLPGPELGRHDELPLDVLCEKEEDNRIATFRRGTKLGVLLDFLARRVTINNNAKFSGSCSNHSEAK